MAQMDGAVSYCFWEICSKKDTGLQGSTLSGPRMTTGFGPFELPTRGLLAPCIMHVGVKTSVNVVAIQLLQHACRSQDLSECGYYSCTVF